MCLLLYLMYTLSFYYSTWCIHYVFTTLPWCKHNVSTTLLDVHTMHLLLYLMYTLCIYYSTWCIRYVYTNLPDAYTMHLLLYLMYTCIYYSTWCTHYASSYYSTWCISLLIINISSSSSTSPLAVNLVKTVRNSFISGFQVQTQGSKVLRKIVIVL